MINLDDTIEDHNYITGEPSLGIRATRALSAIGIDTFRDLISKKESELLQIHNFGKRTLREVKEFLKFHNLYLKDENSTESKEIVECEKRNPEQRTFISLGNRMFFVEDIQSIFIQAGHLIINFEYTNAQQVIFFGYGDDGNRKAKVVFDMLGEMYGAYKIDLPKGTIPDPNIMETAYRDEIDRSIQQQVHWRLTEIKKRHKRKFDKLLLELSQLKEKVKEEERK